MINGPANQTGVTFIEILVALAIIGILAGVAAPSYQDFIRGQRLSGAVDAVYGQLVLAQREAISNNSTRYFRAVVEGDSWCAFAATTSSSVCDDANVKVLGSAYDNISILNLDITVALNVPAYTADPTDITLTDGANEQIIQISANQLITVN